MNTVVSIYDKQEQATAREFARILADQGAFAAAEYVQRWTQQRANLRANSTNQEPRP